MVVDRVGTAGPLPNLWTVSVGISRYPGLTDSDLQVADDDAQAVGKAFEEQVSHGDLFDKLNPTTLIDGQATRDNVLRALDGLAAMQPNDLAVVFLAGHGAEPSPNADMRFLTSDVNENADLSTQGIGWTEISDRLQRVSGRVLVLLDACHAGHLSQTLVVPNGALASSLSRQGRSGVVVFAASKGRQDSAEDNQHGFFTRALIESMTDASADRNKNGHIELSELVDAVTVRVDANTKGRQIPWIVRQELFGDFAVAALGPQLPRQP